MLCRDLLSPGRGNLQIHDGPEGTYVGGCTVSPVATADEVASLLAGAARSRAVASTGLNAQSSRSHLLVTLSFPGGGKLLLADLAGSERLARTGAQGEALAEAKAINKSLSALGNVIACRARADDSSTPELVPYRDSKLTRLLREALCGTAALSLILCASPAAADAVETVTTLRFGARAKAMRCEPARAPAANGGGADAEVEIAALRSKLAALRARLAECERDLAAARESAADSAAARVSATAAGGGARELAWLLFTWVMAVASTRSLPPSWLL